METKENKQEKPSASASAGEKSEKRPLSVVYQLRPDQVAYLKTVLCRDVECKPNAYVYSHPILAITRTAAVKAAWARALRLRDPKTYILDVGGHPYRKHDSPPEQYHALCPLLLPGDHFRDYRSSDISYCHCTFESYVNKECTHCIAPGVLLSIHSFYYLDKGVLWNYLKETGLSLIIVVHHFPEEKGKLGNGEMSYVASGDRVQCQLLNNADKNRVLVDTFEHDSCSYLLKSTSMPFADGSVIWHHDEQVGDHHIYTMKWVPNKFARPDITLSAALSKLDGNVEMSFLNAAAKYQAVASLVDIESCTSWAGNLTLRGKSVTLTIPSAVLAEARVFISWKPRNADTYASLVNVVKASCFRYHLSDSVRQSAITVIPPMAFVMDLEEEFNSVARTHGPWFRRMLWRFLGLGLPERMRVHGHAMRWEEQPMVNYKIAAGVVLAAAPPLLYLFMKRHSLSQGLVGVGTRIAGAVSNLPLKSILSIMALVLRIRTMIPRLSLLHTVAETVRPLADLPLDGPTLAHPVSWFAWATYIGPRYIVRLGTEVTQVAVSALWEELVKRVHPAVSPALSLLESVWAQEPLGLAVVRLLVHQTLTHLPLPAATVLHIAHNLLWLWTSHSPLQGQLRVGRLVALISACLALFLWWRRRNNTRANIESNYEANRAGTLVPTTVTLDQVVRLNSTNYGTRVGAPESGLLGGHQKAMLKPEVKEKPALVGSFLRPAQLPVVVGSDIASQELAVTRCNRRHDFSDARLAVALSVPCGDSYHVLHHMFGVLPRSYETVEEFVDYVGRNSGVVHQKPLVSSGFSHSTFMPVFTDHGPTIDMADYGDCEPYLFEEWVKRYPKGKATMLREAFYHVQMHGMKAVDLKLTSFIKREKYMWSDLFGLDPSKLPRMINGTSPTYNVRFGPFFWKATSLLMETNNMFYNDEYPSGHTLFTLDANYIYVLNSLRRVSFVGEDEKCPDVCIRDWFWTVTGDDALIVLCIKIGEVVFYLTAMVDASKFDGNQSAFVALWEIAAYARLGAPPTLLADYITRPFRGTTFSGLVFELLWQRASGSPNTTLGNSITMGLICSVALVRFSNALFRLPRPIVAEDCVTCLKETLGLVGTDVRCPLEAEVNVHPRIIIAQDHYHLPWFADNEYCSGLWYVAQDLGYQGGLRVAPAFGVLIGRFLARQGWTIDAHDDHFAYLHGAMLSLRPYWNHVPVARAIAMKTIEHCKSRDDRIFYDRGESLPLPKIVNMYEASEETFEIVQLRYGVSKARILELEAIVERTSWPIALGQEFDVFNIDL